MWSDKLALTAGVSDNVFKQTKTAGASQNFKHGIAFKPENTNVN